MFPETSTYMTPLNGTIVTANPTTYPWYERINIIADGMDWNLPIILKEKIWDIGAGKHPSHIINTIYEPVEFTIETKMVDARFLALVTGTTSSAGTQKDVQVITTDTYSDYVDGDQFLIYFMDGTGHIVCYQIYMDVTGDDSGKPAAVTGATATRIDFVTGDGSNNQTATSIISQATLTAEIEAVLEGLTEVTTATVSGSDITLTTVVNNGAVPRFRDHGGNTGVTTFSTTTYGGSTQTVTESTDTDLPSFGLHIEYDNGSEDIVVDLFGCVVIGYETTIDYANKLVQESITIKCPYYVIGNMALFIPPKKTIAPHVWSDVVEAASNYLIMLGTTDKTPKVVNKATLKIENETDWQPEIGTAYAMYPIAGKRNVSLNLVGFCQINDLWTYWYDTWDDANGYYTNAGARLNSEIKLQRTATYDLWQLSIYNWLIETYNLRLFTIDDKIMGIDITFTGATPDSSGYLIDSLSIKDYIAKIFYNVANA